MMDRRRLIAQAGALALSACDKPPVSPVRQAKAVYWDDAADAFRHRDGGLEIVRLWDLRLEPAGFTASNAELRHRSGDGLEVTSLSSDPQLRSPAELRLRGATAPLVLVRLRHIEVTGPWDGALYYSTARHGESAAFMNTPLSPPQLAQGSWSVLAYDMRQALHGGGDWRRSEISQLRLDLDASAGSVSLVSHIALARGP